MNAKILQKCLDELKKDTPDLSYLRGTLETLIEMDTSNDGVHVKPMGIVPPLLTPPPAMFSSKQISASDMSPEEQEYHTRMSGPVAPMHDD